MQFRDFLGADEVKARLSGGPERFPHAVLLLGEKGCGKRTLARWIAAAAVCTDSARRPCGVCRACLRVLEDNHPDVRMLVGTGAGGALKIEQIRELRQDAVRPPLEALVKVYILPDAHKMTEQAQNSLLKILEEPPAGIRFVLTAPAQDKLLPTILSRVQVFRLRAPDVEDCIGWILRERPQADAARVQSLARQFGGNIGQVLETLDQETDEPSLAASVALLNALLEPDENPLLETLAAFSKDRNEFAAVMNRSVLLLRDACAVRAGAQGTIGGEEETAAKLAQQLPQKQLIRLIEVCRRMADAAQRNANMVLLVTACGAAMRTAAGR